MQHVPRGLLARHNFFRNSFILSFVSRARLIPALAVYLLLAGCGAARGPRLAHAGAPGLDGDVRNAVNPNAPFAVAATGPRLQMREPLLDVNGVPPCEAGQLGLFESGAAANGARHVVRLSFENTGQACRLSGFPTVTLLRPDGSVAGSVRLERVSDASMAATLEPAGPEEAAYMGPSPRVLLPARGSAAFTLGWTAGPDCERIGRVAIGAPDSGRPMVLARPLTVCEDRILITAVAPNP